MKSETPRCKVVAQYHSAGEMVYELSSAGTSLEIRISSQAVAPGERSWHVAAQTSLVDAVVVTDHGATKQGALSKVAALWAEQEGELGLPSFDWTAVAAALLAVRAI